MSHSRAFAPSLRPAQGHAYSVLCLALAVAGFATAQVVEALLLLAGVLSHAALVATHSLSGIAGGRFLRSSDPDVR